MNEFVYFSRKECKNSRSGLWRVKKVPPEVLRNKKRPGLATAAFLLSEPGIYSASRISRILMAAVAIGVPGPKMAAAPSR